MALDQAGRRGQRQAQDIIYLDLALESAVRQVVEGALSSMSTRARGRAQDDRGWRWRTSSPAGVE